MDIAPSLSTSTTDRPAASGDFAYWWSLPGDWVEAPNERRNGWSGMIRAHVNGRTYYIKRQRNHSCRTLGHPFGWPTASREWHYLSRLHEFGLPVPTPRYHGTRRTAEGLEAVLVTDELNGFTDLDAQEALDAAQRTRLAATVGTMVGRLHRARLQHGCLYGKHIMVRWQGETPEVALIDLEKMRARLRRSTAVEHDLDQLARHQAIWSADEWAVLLAAHRRGLSTP